MAVIAGQQRDSPRATAINTEQEAIWFGRGGDELHACENGGVLCERQVSRGRETAWSRPPAALSIGMAMNETEQAILETLLELDEAVKRMPTANPKPNLLP